MHTQFGRTSVRVPSASRSFVQRSDLATDGRRSGSRGRAGRPPSVCSAPVTVSPICNGKAVKPSFLRLLHSPGAVTVAVTP